jgi:hypothetical protein
VLPEIALIILLPTVDRLDAEDDVEVAAVLVLALLLAVVDAAVAVEFTELLIVVDIAIPHYYEDLANSMPVNHIVRVATKWQP